MFSPMVGSIIMALAVMACLGSLLGWQFTIAMTGKSAAEDRMFPTLFTKLNGMGAPITGMIVMGVVQTADGALHDLPHVERDVRRSGEPGGRVERGALHHLALGADGDDAEGRHAAGARTAGTSPS